MTTTKQCNRKLIYCESGLFEPERKEGITMKALKIMLLALFLVSVALIAGCQSEQARSYDDQFRRDVEWRSTGTGWYHPQYSE